MCVANAIGPPSSEARRSTVYYPDSYSMATELMPLPVARGATNRELRTKNRQLNKIPLVRRMCGGKRPRPPLAQDGMLPIVPQFTPRIRTHWDSLKVRPPQGPSGDFPLQRETRFYEMPRGIEIRISVPRVNCSNSYQSEFRAPGRKKAAEAAVPKSL